MAQECVFCRIVAGQVPATIVYQDDMVIAFRDVEPQAPTHLLLIPREHVASLGEFGSQHEGLIAQLVHVANELAAKEGIAERGYRLVANCGKEGGQVVPHVHFHLLGGRELSGDMG